MNKIIAKVRYSALAKRFKGLNAEPRGPTSLELPGLHKATALTLLLAGGVIGA